MKIKVCSTCKEDKPLDLYYNSKSTKDGKQNRCKDCQREHMKVYRKGYYEKNKEKIDRQKRQWELDNADYVKAQKKARYQKNRDKILEGKKDYYANNRESILEYKKHYRKANRDKRRHWEAKRYTSKLDRTPSWLTKEHFSEIEAFYTQARDCELVSGQKYHVDHIIPLQGENVCGLHVPWNLQVLPADLNIAKGNRYEETIRYLERHPD